MSPHPVASTTLVICTLSAILFLGSCGQPEPISIERAEPEPPPAEAERPSQPPSQDPATTTEAPMEPPQPQDPAAESNVTSPAPQPDPDFLGVRLSLNETAFRVFAPTAESVTLLLFDSATAPNPQTTHPLTRTADGIWEVSVDQNLEGRFYAYRLTGPDLNPDHQAVDIYAINTVRSTTRARITDLDKTDPPGWTQWKEGPPVASPVDAIIYEMHIRDLTASPTAGVRYPKGYLGWTEPGTTLPGNSRITTALDHLEEIGITHVQILPIHDFENDEASDQYNWGYMTQNFFSPEGMYASNIDDDSRIREFKQVVAALHERGIGVILDVVYNHTGHSAHFNAFAPGYYYRFFPNGAYSNGSGCGNDFRTESPLGRRHIIDSLKFWVEEYGIDGFRFDLMGLMDLETMRLAEKELRAINPDIILYGEPWSAGPTAIQGVQTGKNAIRVAPYGAFNDDFRNALKGSPDGDDPGFIQGAPGFLGTVLNGMMGFTSWIPEPHQTINYMTCHDNLVLIDKLEKSVPGTSTNDQHQMMQLGYFLTLTAQGVPFIHGGEEFARTKHGDHNSYQSGDPINQIDWKMKERYPELYQTVRDLIQIRRDHPLFRLRSSTEIQKRVTFPVKGSDDLHFLATIDGTGLPGESWTQALLLVNAHPDDSIDFNLPASHYQIGFQFPQRHAQPRLRDTRATLPPTSAAILFLTLSQ